MISFLIWGIVLGLSAGIAPGPLLVLVVSETFQYGVRAGIKIAVTPLITDLPIIILSLFVLEKLSRFDTALGFISLLGGGFILFMGIQNLRIKNYTLPSRQVKSMSLVKGILANALSPHPYIFWFSVGGPILIKAMNQNIIVATAFIVSFYLLLVGSKIILAVLVNQSRAFITGNAYLYTMRILGMLLCALAFLLFREGLQLLWII